MTPQRRIWAKVPKPGVSVARQTRGFRMFVSGRSWVTNSGIRRFEKVSARSCLSALTDAEGNAGNQLATEAVLKPVEDLFSTIADDLAQPNVAVHGDEECSFAHAGGLSLCDDGRIEKFVPD